MILLFQPCIPASDRNIALPLSRGAFLLVDYFFDYKHYNSVGQFRQYRDRVRFKNITSVLMGLHDRWQKTPGI